MKKIINLRVFFLVLILSSFALSPQSVFWFSWEIKSTETLREMQEKIDSLKEEKQVLDFKWKNFRIGNENLGDLIKKDLSEEEKSEIERLILDYNEDKENFEEDIEVALEALEAIDDIQRDLILLKQDFYTSLIPYLQDDKLEGFRKYVESDLTLREKSNEVATQIEQKNIERTERVDELQEQIKHHKEQLYEQIKEKVTSRVTQRLDEFILQEKFQELPSESKIAVFERLILKIQERNAALEENSHITSIAQETKVLYEVIEEILNSYISLWK